MKQEEPIVIKCSFSTAAIAAVIVMPLSAAAFAAWVLLTPGEVAEQLRGPALSDAFNSKNVININASQTANGYTFTLMTIVSSEDVSDDRFYQSWNIGSGSTYVIAAIQKRTEAQC